MVKNRIWVAGNLTSERMAYERYEGQDHLLDRLIEVGNMRVQRWHIEIGNWVPGEE